jgi:hypothetical protein
MCHWPPFTPIGGSADHKTSRALRLSLLGNSLSPYRKFLDRQEPIDSGEREPIDRTNESQSTRRTRANRFFDLPAAGARRPTRKKPFISFRHSGIHPGIPLRLPLCHDCTVPGGWRPNPSSPWLIDFQCWKCTY